MITKRLLILLAVIVCGMGVVFILPKFNGAQPMGVTLALPEEVGGWYGTDKEVTDREKQVLGHDTEFARKTYRDAKGNQVLVTIVLAGQDVTTSLHQPERCLPAQGWRRLDSRLERVPLDGSNLSSLTATRLHNVMTVPLSNGGTGQIFCLYYYWFVGRSDLCATPFGRSVVDWRDRIFKGFNQRWAYITVVTGVNGNNPAATEASDAVLKKFVAELFPKIWKPGSVSQS